MISAQLEYNITSKNPANNFVKLNFSSKNFNTRFLLNKLAYNIKYKKYDISEAKIKLLQEQKSKNNEQIAKLVKQLEETKQKYKIVRLHKDVFNEYVEIKSQIEKIHKQNQQIDHRIFQLDRNKYYEETKLKLMYENLLKGLGFSAKKSKENWILFEFNGNEQTFQNNLENIATALLEKRDREIAESVEDLKNEMSAVIEK